MGERGNGKWEEGKEKERGRDRDNITQNCAVLAAFLQRHLTTEGEVCTIACLFSSLNMNADGQARAYTTNIQTYRNANRTAHFF